MVKAHAGALSAILFGNALQVVSKVLLCVYCARCNLSVQRSEFFRPEKCLKAVDTPWTQFGHSQIKRAYVFT